jgi:hypothetical protein
VKIATCDGLLLDNPKHDNSAASGKAGAGGTAGFQSAVYATLRRSWIVTLKSSFVTVDGGCHLNTA